MNCVGKINGMNVFVSVNCAEHITTKRSWKERLFTLPFTPFRKYKTEHVPSKKIMVSNGSMVMHPIMYEEFKINYEGA